MKIWTLILIMVISGCMGPRTQGPEASTEVLVIGGGGAGLAAAVEAASLGARVILVEKSEALGGVTLKVQEGLSASDTHIQKESGVLYSAKEFERDIVEFGSGRSIRKLAQVLARESAEAVRWLEELGVQLELPDPEGAPWIHRAVPGSTGGEVVKALQKRLDGLDVDLRLNARVTELLTDERGGLVGARVAEAGGREYLIESGSVILATGGFGGNADMISRFANQWDGISVKMAGSGAQGEGLRMAMAAGADITHMQYLRVFPTMTPEGTPVEGLTGAGGVLINREGKRFVDETQQDAVVARLLMDQKGKRAFILGDGSFLDMAEGILKAEPVTGAETLEDLARKVGVPGEALVSTIEEYNDFERDDEFGRVERPKVLQEPPFFAVEVTPGVWATLGGLKINEDAQVLREGERFPGFYAAGEVVGGIFGADERGTGLLTSDLVFGRLAARSAVEAVKQKSQ